MDTRTVTSTDNANIELRKEMADKYPGKEGFKVRLSDTKCDDKSLSSSKKWSVSLLSGILFLIISSPFLYNIVNKLMVKVSPNLVLCDDKGCPTPLGLAVHTIVFILVVRLLMR